MTKIKKAMALTIVTVMMFALCACGKSTIVGSWEATEGGTTVTYTFNKDGTGSVDMAGIALSTTYTVDGDKIKMTMSFLGETEEETYTYAIKGKTLTLTAESSGEAVDFTKK